MMLHEMEKELKDLETEYESLVDDETFWRRVLEDDNFADEEYDTILGKINFIETQITDLEYEMDELIDKIRHHRKAFEYVLDQLRECGLFIGKYDAEHGNEHFMFGVGTVMECIAYNVSDRCGDYFNDTFTDNMTESEGR